MTSIFSEGQRPQHRGRRKHWVCYHSIPQQGLVLEVLEVRIRVGGPGVTVRPKAPKREAPGWLEQAQDGCKGHSGGN
jgi:hypothetical protein